MKKEQDAAKKSGILFIWFKLFIDRKIRLDVENGFYDSSKVSS